MICAYYTEVSSLKTKYLKTLTATAFRKKCKIICGRHSLVQKNYS